MHPILLYSDFQLLLILWKQRCIEIALLFQIEFNPIVSTSLLSTRRVLYLLEKKAIKFVSLMIIIQESISEGILNEFWKYDFFHFSLAKQPYYCTHPFILRPRFLQSLEIWFEKSGSRNLVREKWLTRKKGGFIP